MIDGPLTDTEIATALDQVHAGTIILAIDACYSGGFADDFVRRPGRIVLFSSDEDVRSSLGALADICLGTCEPACLDMRTISLMTACSTLESSPISSARGSFRIIA